MRKIIVPVDYSEASKNALKYAQYLATYLGLAIEVVHIAIEPYEPFYPYYDIITPKFLLKKRAKLQKFVLQSQIVQKASAVSSIQIDSFVGMGNAINEIIKISQRDDVEMILMGTTGAGGLMGRLFGSVSSKVAQRSSSPVLLIPPSIQEFKIFNQILYACHYLSFTEKLLKRIRQFTRRFDAAIHWVHINNASTDQDAMIDNQILKMLFNKYYPEVELPLVTIDERDIWAGLTHYAQLKDIDLIVLGSPHRNFLGQLFHRSLTKQMVLRAQRPILVLPI